MGVLLTAMGNTYVHEEDHQRVQYFTGAQPNGKTVARVMEVRPIRSTRHLQ